MIFANNKTNKLAAFAAGAVLGLGAGGAALADDTELFVGSVSGDAAMPNILFIIDTSGSMEAKVGDLPPYVPSTTYEGPCISDRIYWQEGSGDIPADICSEATATGSQWFSASALRCNRAANAIASRGESQVDFFAQYDPDTLGGSWNMLSTDDSARDHLVECSADGGLHGDGVDTEKVWAADSPNGPWSANDADEVAWGTGKTGTQYSLYEGNFINYRNGIGVDERPTRLEVVQQVTKSLVDDIGNVNVGLMRFSNNGSSQSGDAVAEGGMVLFDIAPVANSREELKAIVDELSFGGFTPLSETLFEAGQYFLGRDVVYGIDSRGNDSAPQPSVPESREGPNLELYQSPADGLACRKNFIVLLTDGMPTADAGADSLIAGLPGFSEATGNADCTGTGDGRCLDDMAAYLFNRDLNDSVDDGLQNVITYTIGFATDFELLQTTAERGGGAYFTANDLGGLENVFDTIIDEVTSGGTTFAGPAAAVNAFNRTQNLNELYYAVFQPSSTPHWDGNLKKYRFLGGEIFGQNDLESAVDPDTGFFRDSSRSLWSDVTDGADARAGGAASRLPSPITRKLYTNVSADIDLSAASNRMDTDNAAITAGLLGIGGPDDPDRETLIEWARGHDVLDSDGDGDVAEARKIIGDPLHATPVVVVYGGTPGAPDLGDAIVFISTNDGYLHAVDAATGAEQFAFIPVDLLDNLPELFENTDSAAKTYGLDGSIQVLRKDLNNDGIIEAGAGDRVILYFGMRRGGTNYYALEVTDPDRPQLLWTVGSDELPRIGQTWSPPVISQVDIAGETQNDTNTVLIMGGGYPVAGNQDNPGYSTDGTGNAVYMLDALSGARLWSAGQDESDNLQLSQMNNAIPAGIRVIDLNNDGFADRMYAGDMGGRVWRFDIFNGQNANSLVTGGVLASLGGAALEAPTVANNRRFYNTPDIALIARENDSYLNIAIGSGYRAHPLNTQTEDRFYGLRDYNVFQQLSQLDYDAISANPILDSDPQLVDVTNDLSPVIPEGALGWKLSLPGEKVLSESRTFDGTIIFTSFTPIAAGSACVPGKGLNKLYQIDILDARPVTNLDGIGSSEELTLSDRSRDLAQAGIAPTPTFLFPAPDGTLTGDGEVCEGEECSCEGDDCGFPTPRCIVGLEACDIDFGNPPVRTFWTQRDVDSP